MRLLCAADRAIVSGLLEPFRGNAGLAEQRQGATASSRRSLGWMGCVVIMTAVGGTLALVVGDQTRHGGLALVYIGGGFLSSLALYRWWCARTVRQRREMIDRDLPALLTTVASSVRAGIDPIRAMCDAESYFSPRSPFVSEIKKFKNSFAQGKDEIAAIEDFLADDSSVDLHLFKQSLLLSRQLGSSLADPLHRVVRVVRTRQSFRRKTRAALAMHRMSAVGIALCAVLIVGMQVAVDSSRVAMTVQHPVGKVLLCSGVLLIGVGVIWMLRMGREERI